MGRDQRERYLSCSSVLRRFVIASTCLQTLSQSQSHRHRRTGREKEKESEFPPSHGWKSIFSPTDRQPERLSRTYLVSSVLSFLGLSKYYTRPAHATVSCAALIGSLEYHRNRWKLGIENEVSEQPSIVGPSDSDTRAPNGSNWQISRAEIKRPTSRRPAPVDLRGGRRRGANKN